MKKNRSHRLIRFLLLVIAYLTVAVPFMVMQVIPGFTDVRPVMMLWPVFGAFFGIEGCMACAVSNLIMDIISSSLRWSSIAGFAANFIGPFMVYWYWTRISQKSFSLRAPSLVLRHVIVIVLGAAVETLIITPAVAFIYPDVNARLFATTCMLNTSLFPIVLGIPLSILISEELGFLPQPSKKQREKAQDTRY